MWAGVSQELERVAVAVGVEIGDCKVLQLGTERHKKGDDVLDVFQHLLLLAVLYLHMPYMLPLFPEHGDEGEWRGGRHPGVQGEVSPEGGGGVDGDV